MSVATVVGMSVAIQKSGGGYAYNSNIEKTFLSFPDEKDRDACFLVKMLMLDG